MEVVCVWREIVYPSHLISSQICEEFDQKKPEGQDKPQRLGEGLMYTVSEGLIYTVSEGVNVYSREGLIYTVGEGVNVDSREGLAVPNSETLGFHFSIHEDVPQSIHDVLQQKVPHSSH